ncbi:unnamed protein product [Callosobruchus maculatus]|uniref:Uncharacterized protein n=1 Tax=Callosobruchus maculatus TaxID=64391 RepID=A0A653CB28_CALMS|nr:unnamed protein product [Callosobruchus maculatus]
MIAGGLERRGLVAAVLTRVGWGWGWDVTCRSPPTVRHTGHQEVFTAVRRKIAARRSRRAPKVSARFNQRRRLNENAHIITHRLVARAAQQNQKTNRSQDETVRSGAALHFFAFCLHRRLPAGRNQRRHEHTVFGAPFDEIVVDTSLVVRRKNPNRQSRNNDNKN